MACCHCSLHNLNLNLCRDLLTGNFLNESHHSFTIISLVIPVGTTDLTSFGLVHGLRSHYYFLVHECWYLFLLEPALLSPALRLNHVQFCYSTGHSCSLYVWCPYNRSRLYSAPASHHHHMPAGLSLPAYVIRGTLILSALQCLWVTLHSHGTDCLSHCLYHFWGLNKLFNFLLSSKASFSLAFTVVISAA